MLFFKTYFKSLVQHPWIWWTLRTLVQKLYLHTSFLYSQCLNFWNFCNDGSQETLKHFTTNLSIYPRLFFSLSTFFVYEWFFAKAMQCFVRKENNTATLLRSNINWLKNRYSWLIAETEFLELTRKPGSRN